MGHLQSPWAKSDERGSHESVDEFVPINPIDAKLSQVCVVVIHVMF